MQQSLWQPFQLEAHLISSAPALARKGLFFSYAMSSDTEHSPAASASQPDKVEPVVDVSPPQPASFDEVGLDTALAGLLVQLQDKKSNNKDHIDNQLKEARSERLAAAKAAKAATAEKRRLERKRSAAVAKCAKHSTQELLEALRVRLQRQEQQGAKKQKKEEKSDAK